MRRSRWRLVLAASFCGTATAAASSDALLSEVVQHVKAVGGEIYDLFVHFCQPSDPSALVTKFERHEVEVPSCSTLRDAGLEMYYGNINMLMAEAWRVKVVGSLQNLLQQPDLPRPQAELLLVREPSDGTIAGGIFISQLLQSGASPNGHATLGRVALMIGIHRMPRHKIRRHLGRTDAALNVTPAIVARAQQWTVTHALESLLVCPLAGDGGALRERFLTLGFRDDVEGAWDGGRDDGGRLGQGQDGMEAGRWRLGGLDLRYDVCEEAGLMRWSAAPGRGGRDEL